MPRTFSISIQRLPTGIISLETILVAHGLQLATTSRRQVHLVHAKRARTRSARRRIRFGSFASFSAPPKPVQFLPASRRANVSSGCSYFEENKIRRVPPFLSACRIAAKSTAEKCEMLLQADVASAARSRPSGVSPGILDSPTLARVERAMLRHEEGVNREGQDLLRAQYTQSLLSTNFGKDSTHAIKRGLLWQQRDKIFSRWKERYFILTRDYLHCFRRASGNDRITEMGQFLFKVKLVDVDRVEWENKKTYSTVALVLGRDGKIYLRASDGLEDWFELLEECMLTSKERRRALRHSHDGKPRDNNNITASLDEWLAARQKIPMGRAPADKIFNGRQETVKRREWTPREEDWENPTLDNRLSRKTAAAKQNGTKRGRKRKWFFANKNILTDIDINSYDDSTLGAPSVTSYRLNQDVLCIQPPSLRPSGSFRSSKDANNTSTKRTVNVNIPDSQCQYIKFRERSYSDIQRVERKPWRAIAISSRQFE